MHVLAQHLLAELQHAWGAARQDSVGMTSCSLDGVPEVGVPVTGVRGVQGGLPAHMPHRIALSSLTYPVIKQPFKVVLSSRLLPLSMLVVWRSMLPVLQRMLPQGLLLSWLRLLI